MDQHYEYRDYKPHGKNFLYVQYDNMFNALLVVKSKYTYRCHFNYIDKKRFDGSLLDFKPIYTSKEQLVDHYMNSGKIAEQVEVLNKQMFFYGII